MRQEKRIQRNAQKRNFLICGQGARYIPNLRSCVGRRVGELSPRQPWQRPKENSSRLSNAHVLGVFFYSWSSGLQDGDRTATLHVV
jgi:hypothetical protein